MAVPVPLWHMKRITRDGRREIEGIDIDGGFLAQAASDQQALLVDRCPPEKAALLLCGAAPLMFDGVMWVITANDTSYTTVRNVADRCRTTQVWAAPHLIYDVHPKFMNPETWKQAEYRLLLMAAASLRDSSYKNPRQRQEVLGMFAPLIAVIDPQFQLCTMFHGWDPAWVIRQLVSQLCLNQPGVAVAVFTEREAISFSSSLVQSAYGVSGLMYLDGASARRYSV